uniref:GATA zinc finger domain-containing protein 14-like n=1 Tax=Pundamilia nyererei TaxID=303518 RepID=A0A3B4F0L4_9CICH
MPLSTKHVQRVGATLGLVLPFIPLRSLIFYYFLSCAAAAGSLPGIEYDYGISPKFVCTPIPPEADPSCFSPPNVPHGPSSMMSDEAKATILHLRESLVRQKETILDQRETIRELNAKLTLCEGFGGHHSTGHHDSHHDNHHDNHHDSHHDKQTGKTLQTLKERLENLQVSMKDYSLIIFCRNQKLKSPTAFLLDFPMRTNYMYGRMRRSVVMEIFALTICLWLKAGAGPGLGTPFSYSVPGQANELVLIEWGSNPMELLINDKAATLPITMTDEKWHHVCVTWSTRDGVWEAYQDGAKKGTGQNLSAWHPIKPGGIFILGQEQDTMGGRFDVTQSFVGELSDLQFWSRVLTSSEIYSQATCGGHLVGDVMSWSEESVELHGGLTELSFDPCH